VAGGGPARRLPGAVRRVLRPPARQHADPGGGRHAGRLRRLDRPGGRAGRRRRGRRPRPVRAPDLRRLPHRPGHAGAGEGRPRPHALRPPRHARRRREAPHRREPGPLDRRSPVGEAGGHHAADHTPGRPARLAGRLPGRAPLMATTVGGTPPPPGVTTGLATPELLEEHWSETPGLGSFLTTVDHKRIGKRYLYTGLLFLVIGGVESLVMRIQLSHSNLHVLDPETYNQLFSMHGVTMMFLFATPVLSGFGNYLVPLMIGARDMAFPRLNAFGYWVFLGAGIFFYTSFLVHRLPDAGWFNYTPLSDSVYSSGPNVDFYALGLIFIGISTTAGSINFIVTILKMRAPGMSLNRMPIFIWGELAMALTVVFALPALTLANILLELERRAGFHFFSAAGGGQPLLWQHLFWIFGHPEVYLVVLPALGIASAIIPVFCRRPMIGYTYIVLAEMAIALIGFGVWVHHMFATGLPTIGLGFISLTSFLVVIPSGVQIFAWLATLW